MNLNDRKWDAFFIGGSEGVFELRSTNSGIDKNKLIFDTEETIPYITRSDLNNGVSLFVCEKQKDKYHIDPANVITIGLDTQTVFYQPYNFYTGQNIQILYNDHINKYTALFISRMLKVQLQKLNWGGNGATLGRLIRTKILLPVNDTGNPDYLFMESYIKSIQTKRDKSYKGYCKRQLEKLGKIKNIPPLNEKEWKAFFVDSIFELTRRGKRIISDKYIPGDMPVVSSAGGNNGVIDFAGNKSNVRIYDNCLSVANGGVSAGFAFYQPYPFIATDHVTHFKNSSFSMFHYMFLGTVIKIQMHTKFDFNREISDPRLKREKLNLPVDESGNPDFEYMEQYIKNLMIKKYTSYCLYLTES